MQTAALHQVTFRLRYTKGEGVPFNSFFSVKAHWKKNHVARGKGRRSAIFCLPAYNKEERKREKKSNTGRYGYGGCPREKERADWMFPQPTVREVSYFPERRGGKKKDLILFAIRREEEKKKRNCRNWPFIRHRSAG